MKKNVACFFFAVCVFIPAYATSGNLNQIYFNSAQRIKPGIEFQQFAGDHFRISIEIPAVATSPVRMNNVNYTKITIHDFQRISKAGEPALPVKGFFISVPSGAEIDIQITNSQYSEIDSISVAPAQDAEPESGSTQNSVTLSNEDIYKRNRFFPERLAWAEPVKIIRGCPVTVLWIAPVQFNPVTQRVRVYTSFDVEVRFSTESDDFIDSHYLSPHFERILSNLVVNQPAWKSKRDIQLSESLGTESSVYGCDYLIITHRLFAEAADSLSSWRKLCGLESDVFFVEDIGQSAYEIREFIQEAYQYWRPAPTYVLLLGDAEFVQTNYETKHAKESNGLIGTDLYYAAIDGNDYFPDIFTGRVPVEDPQEAMSFVRKTIRYEEDPVADPGFYNRAVTAAYFQDDDDPDTQDYNERDGYSDRRFVLTSEEIRNYLIASGYAVDRVYYALPQVNPTNYSYKSGYANGEPLPPELLRANGFLWNGSASEISSAIEQGCFMVSHRDHGSRNGWGDPAYKIAHVDNLRNGDLLPLILSVNCNTGWFDNETDESICETAIQSECFVESWLRNRYGGAIGVFGSTRVSYSGYNDALAKGFVDAVFPEFLGYQPGSQHLPIYQLGQILNYGKFYMATEYSNTGKRKIEFEEFHCFGDPATSLRTKQPQTFSIDVDDTCHLNQTNLVVNISEAAATVALVQNDELLSTTVSDAQGFAQLEFSPIQTDDMLRLCVTKANFIPNIQEIQVLPTKGVNLVCDTHRFVDQNRNDELNIGESVQCMFEIVNRGSLMAHDITLSLISEDTFIEMIDSSIIIESIDAGDRINVDGLSFRVKNNCPGNHHFLLSLKMETSTGFNSLLPFELMTIGGVPSIEVDPDVITMYLNSVEDTAVSNLTISNTGFGNLSFELVDEGNRVIHSGNTSAPVWAVSPNGIGNVYFIRHTSSLYRFSSYVKIESPINAHFFVYEGDQLNGTYERIETTSRSIDSIGEMMISSGPLGCELKSGKYYFLGMSWDGGNAKIGRNTRQTIPTEIPIGQIVTGAVNLGGVPPADSIDQKWNDLPIFMQEIETRAGEWLFRPPISGTIKPLDVLNVPLRFRATADDTIFSTTVNIISNDEIHDTLFVPIYLSVGNSDLHLICYVDSIDDHLGNANGELNNGETISIPLRVNNLSQVGAVNVSVSLQSTDDYISVIDDVYTIDQLKGQEELPLNVFKCRISPYCPEDHVMNFTIVLSSGDYQTSHEFSRKVREGEPVIDFHPDSVMVAMQHVGDSLTVPLRVRNQGFGRLIYQLENPVQELHSIGRPADDAWLPLNEGIANVYYIEDSVHLLSVESFMQIDSSSTIYFYVYEGDSLNGTFHLKAQSEIQTDGSRRGWTSSPLMECDLKEKKYYYIGTSWAGKVKACRVENSIPFDIWAGELICGGYGLAGVPPKETIHQRFYNFVPVAQRLVTGIGWWLQCPTEADTLYPEELVDIPINLYGSHPDTFFRTSLSLLTNDAENPIAHIPVSLNVSGSTGLAGNPESAPWSFDLLQNYPNPFNAKTKIIYHMLEAEAVEISIYNTLGQCVRKLMKGHFAPGRYEIEWNGQDESGLSMPTGIYLVVLKTSVDRFVRKALLLK